MVNKYLLVFFLLLPSTSWAAFTEFYCNPSTGSNMNGGSEEATSPSYSATNGGWNSGTGVFTPTSGDPSASVTVGEYASVFTDGASTPVFIGRVTAVNSTTVTVSTTLKSGTAPTTAGSGISINVGGVWKGPNAADDFPFDLMQHTMRNDDSSCARVNFKNNTAYDTTATITLATDTGPIVFQGYTTTVGDGGFGTVDGGATGTRFTVLNSSNSQGKIFRHLYFTRGGATGSAQNLLNTHSATIFDRCRFSHGSASGCTQGIYIGCESYSHTLAGFNSGTLLYRCTSHSNGTRGFSVDSASNLNVIDCIAHNNGTAGFYLSSSSARTLVLAGCDAYENTGDGFEISKNASAGAQVTFLENCNSVKNGGYGIGLGGAGTSAVLSMRKVGFGAGTMANTSGNVESGTLMLADDTSFSYANDVTPWVDPENGDFTLNLAAAINAGYAEFLTVSGVFTGGTTSFPDIGAAAHEESEGGGGGGTDQITIVPFYGSDIQEDSGDYPFEFNVYQNGIPFALVSGAVQGSLDSGADAATGLTLNTIATGRYEVVIDSDNAVFNGGGNLALTLSAGTVDGNSVVNAKVGEVSIGRNATAPTNFESLSVDGSGAVLIQDGTDPGQIATTGGAIDTVTTVTQLTAATTEPTSVPSATAGFIDKVNWLFLIARNKKTVTDALIQYFADDGSTVIGEKDLTDDDTTFTEAEATDP